MRLGQRCIRLAARQFGLISKGVFAGPTYAWAVDSIVALTKKPAREVTRASEHVARHPFYADDCTDALRMSGSCLVDAVARAVMTRRSGTRRTKGTCSVGRGPGARGKRNP